jgi:hypothetical protein
LAVNVPSVKLDTQGQITPSFVVTTPHGNTAPAVTATALIDTIAPTVSIDAISTDNVINAQEHGQPLVITGKTDAENGQTVHVDVNGKDHTAVATNGHFTTTVPATEVGAFTDGQHLNVIANVTDHAGNTAQPAIAQLIGDIASLVGNCCVHSSKSCRKRADICLGHCCCPCAIGIYCCAIIMIIERNGYNLATFNARDCAANW